MAISLLILTIAFNTALAFIFKLFQRWDVELFPAVVLNYFICVITAWPVLGKFPVPAEMTSYSWFPFALVLGVIFIVGFNIVGITVQQFGVTLATIMQKMSLLLTVPAAILLHQEQLGLVQSIGVGLALLAIILSNYKNEGPGIGRYARGIFYLFPFFTLLVSASIEIILQYTEMKVSEVSADPEFIASSFFLAGLMGTIVWIFLLFTGRMKFRWKQLGAAIVLGVPNFFSIYFIMRSLGAGWDGAVFYPLNNVGIIFASVLLAMLLLGEKLNTAQWIGLILSILSIVLIAVGIN